MTVDGLAFKVSSSPESVPCSPVSAPSTNMAAALVARGPVRSRSTEILCVGSFSIVVDSVDGDVTGGPADDEVFGEDGALPGGGGGGEGDLRSSNASSRGSRTSISKEETDAKLALFRVRLRHLFLDVL